MIEGTLKTQQLNNKWEASFQSQKYGTVYGFGNTKKEAIINLQLNIKTLKR